MPVSQMCSIFILTKIIMILLVNNTRILEESTNCIKILGGAQITWFAQITPTYNHGQKCSAQESNFKIDILRVKGHFRDA